MSTDPTGQSSPVTTEDSASADGDIGLRILTVRKDTAASTAGSDGDYAFLATDPNGKLWTNSESMNKSARVVVTPTLANAGAYAIGDLVGAPFEIAAALASPKLSGWLQVSGIDKASVSQKASLTFWFFQTQPTFANADNGVFSITDANLASAGFLGTIAIDPSQYSASDSNAVFSSKDLLAVKGASTSLWCAILTNSAPTYAAGDLIINFFIAQD